MKPMRYVLWLVLFALIAAAIYFIFFTRHGIRLTHINLREFSDYLQSFGTYAIVVGMLAIFIQTWFPFVPFVLIAGANVLVFGLCWGFIINYTMSCAGAVSAFLFARYFARDWVNRKLSQNPALYKFNKILEKKGFTYILMARLIPIIPSSAINLGSSVSQISIRHFFLATMLGKLPIIFLESMIGHDLLFFKQNKGRLLLLLLIFSILLGIGGLIKKKWILKKDV